MTFKLATSPYILRVVGTFGDVNPLDYGGGFVFVHSQTPDTFDFEYVEPPCEDDWDCPTCSGYGSADCTLVPYPYPESRHFACEHEECDAQGEWTCITCKGTGKNPALRWTVYRGLVERIDWPNWRSVAATCGQDVYDYVRIMKDPDYSPEPMEMMRVIEDVASNYGWHELDSDPFLLSYTEIHERYDGFKPHA